MVWARIRWTARGRRGVGRGWSEVALGNVFEVRGMDFSNV